MKKINLQSVQKFLQTSFRFVLRVLKGIWYFWAACVLLIVLIIGYFIVADTSRVGKLTPQYEIYRSGLDYSYRVKDNYTDKWATEWLNSVDMTFGKDSLVRFSKRSFHNSIVRYGYLDVRDCNKVVKAQFDIAGTFSGGMAAVRQAGKFGFINTDGEFVFTLDKPICNIEKTCMRGGYAIIDIGGKYGIISNKGEWTIEPKWNNIEEIKRGLFIISNGCRKGLWSVTKGWIYDVEYDNIVSGTIVDQLLVVTKDGWSWEIDYSGKVVKDFVFDTFVTLNYNKMGEYEDVCVMSEFAVFSIGDQLGLYNMRTRKAVTPAIYYDIEMISPDLFVVSGCGEGSFLMDSKGNIIGNKNNKTYESNQKYI